MEVKAIGMLLMIFGCFVVLYPKIFHPMILMLFGLNQKAEPPKPMYPPGTGRAPPGGGQHMHGRAPHPGMRAAQEAQMGSQRTGGGGGWLTVVLPVYSIGIVCFLIYTLTKIWGKKDERKLFTSGRTFYTGQQRKITQDSPPSTDEDENKHVGGMSKKTRRELERLLVKAENENISHDEMLILRQRLQETESQLSRIMNSMEDMSGQVEQVVSERATEESQQLEKDTTEDVDDSEPELLEGMTDEAESTVLRGTEHQFGDNENNSLIIEDITHDGTDFEAEENIMELDDTECDKTAGITGTAADNNHRHTENNTFNILSENSSENESKTDDDEYIEELMPQAVTDLKDKSLNPDENIRKRLPRESFID